ncbi:hypothetical protein [Ramlibacter sp. WS9]|uniref:hypothetical protein n=1 Tax=Ramlibacter sp. WS9 TaxID=1882741 RepID=UPI0011728548|nr:hypothetical protein [Ramlibacter sp. WS9]ROZ61387.1 hypothetical protein EEB15_33010 [Ramlibacter sp. WS9]
MQLKYSFSLTPPVTPKPAEKLVEYSYSEFLLDLPEHWKQYPTPQDNTFNWHSEVENAGITISADFFEVPDEKAFECAEVCLKGRHDAMEALAPGQVTQLTRTIKPHSQGVGLEISYSAQIPGHTYIYVGYITSRKIFNLGLTCGPDKFAAADLFNKTMRERVRVKLP